MSETDMTDRVLAILQTRYPAQFEIAVLTAQNEILAAQLAAANADVNHELDLTEPPT